MAGDRLPFVGTLNDGTQVYSNLPYRNNEGDALLLSGGVEVTANNAICEHPQELPSNAVVETWKDNRRTGYYTWSAEGRVSVQWYHPR